MILVFPCIPTSVNIMWSFLLAWCRHIIIVVFALLKFALWYWNTFLNVVMLYIILMCISRFMFFGNDLLSESEVAQLCLTLWDPVDCSPPGSSVHGILQARILEWVAISFSKGSSRPRDWTRVSHIAGRCFNLWATREAPWWLRCSWLMFD